MSKPLHIPPRLIFCVLVALLGSGPVPAQYPVYYEYETIAHDTLSVNGETIDTIESKVSVNEMGQVAFMGNVGEMRQVFVGDSYLTPLNISHYKSPRNVDFVQINNQGRVVVRELSAGHSLVRVWNAHSPGAYNLLATTTTTGFGQITIPTIGNADGLAKPPMVGFLGRIGDLPFDFWMNDSLQPNMQEQVTPLTGTTLRSFRPMASATEERVFVMQFQGATGPQRIAVYGDQNDEGLWSGQLLANSDSEKWEQLGSAPAISDTGKIVVFSAVEEDHGQSIYMAYMLSGPWSDSFRLKRVVDLERAIACDENGEAITFAELDLDARLGVLHQEFDPPGLKGDKIIVSFLGRPEKGSVPNPALPGRNLMFTWHKGLWTIQVDFEEQLANPTARPRPNLNTAWPVIQEGDWVDENTVDTIHVWDALATPARKPDGRTHDPSPGDHYVGFAVETSGGVKVARAAWLDTDGDSLPDHWETDGVDIDGNGFADLDLKRLGAQPDRKDLFLEIDWLADRTFGVSTPWSNAPAPQITHRLAEMFANAPVDNPDGSTGITLHIDAGPGTDPTGLPYSVNMGINESYMAGGDIIRAPGNPDEHLDVVYFGKPETLKVHGVATRSFHAIKNEYFGHHLNQAWAREFAFKYAVLADFHSFVLIDGSATPFTSDIRFATLSTLASKTDLPAEAGYGHAVKIVQGTGAGQVRNITGRLGNLLSVYPDFETVPDETSYFCIFHGSGGFAEGGFEPWPRNNGRPANDMVITLAGYGVSAGWLGTGRTQWETLGHELGHTLGLRHGGIDHRTNRPNYRSIMNYYFNRRPSLGVVSYSDATDPVFNDWATIKLDWPRSGYFVGNTFVDRFHNGRPVICIDSYPWKDPIPPPPPPPPLPPPVIIENVDLEPPTVVILQPDEGAFAATDSDLTVTAHANDNVGVERILLHFDKDGDGRRSVVSEASGGDPNAQGNRSATFRDVSGPFGAREVIASASDFQGNWGADKNVITAGQGNGDGVWLSQSNGTFPAQSAGAARQMRTEGPFDVPGTGAVCLTVVAEPSIQDLPFGVRQDARVTAIFFDGERQFFEPVFTARGIVPSVCSAYWTAPGPGKLTVELSGPVVRDINGNALAHAAQNWKLDVSHTIVDITAPEAGFVTPGANEFAETGDRLPVSIMATDDYTIQSVNVWFDANGDDDTDDNGETITAARAGDTFNATSPVITGAPGVRQISILARDEAGNETKLTQSIEVRLPDTTKPIVAIQSPAPGSPFEAETMIDVAVFAEDEIAIASVEARFDTDGDGTAETYPVAFDSNNVFRARLPALSGANGARTLLVRALDTSGNVAENNIPITIGGVEPVTTLLFTDESGHFDAQSSSFSGGSRQSQDYAAIQIPSSGKVVFTVTATPPVRRAVQNISRADPTVRFVTFNGEALDLSATCNDFGSDPAVCTTELDVDAGGMLEFAVLGPGTWNIWGEFSGHAAQDYVLEVHHTSIDIDAAQVTLASPAQGANLALDAGPTFEVHIDDGDGTGVASAVLALDVDGDGETAGLNEQIAATHVNGTLWRATFPKLQGAAGPRDLTVVVTDSSFNRSETSVTFGVDGAGGGERSLHASSGTIPGQPSDFGGGSRQVVPVSGVNVPGMGRVTIRLTAWPPARYPEATIPVSDAEVKALRFNGSDVTLRPVYTDPGVNPSVVTAEWDAPQAGTLNFDILGAGSWNIWGEFSGSPTQTYLLDVLFRPGPTVDTVAPASGSIAGGTRVTVTGSGFGNNAVVLFNGVPARNVTRESGGNMLVCTTPPGAAGTVDVRVLNSDPDGQDWNYGGPWGLYGSKIGAYTYTGTTARLGGETLIGTWSGNFQAAGRDGSQASEVSNFTLPGAGRLRFETHAFKPILSPVPGPFEDRGDLLRHNDSSSVPHFRAGNGSSIGTAREFSPIDFPYGAVIANATAVISASHAGSGNFTVRGPARWNAFWLSLDVYEMLSAPEQDWSTAVWFAPQPTLTNISPASGPTVGGGTVVLTGSNFGEGTHVLFGEIAATEVETIDDGTMICTVPPRVSGSVAVTVEYLGMTARIPGGYTYLPGPDPAIDPDGDGLASSIERYLGLDPNVANQGEPWVVDFTQQGALEFTYPRARDTGDLSGRVEWSTDLGTWHSEEITQTVIDDVAGEPFVIIRASINIPRTAVYVRLVVEE